MWKLRNIIYDYAKRGSAENKKASDAILTFSFLMAIMISLLWLVWLYQLGSLICSASHNVDGYLPNLFVLSIGVCCCVVIAPFGFLGILLGGPHLLNVIISEHVGIYAASSEIDARERAVIEQGVPKIYRESFFQMLQKMKHTSGRRFTIFQYTIQFQDVLVYIAKNNYTLELHKEEDNVSLNTIQDFTLWFRNTWPQQFDRNTEINLFSKRIGIHRNELEYIEAGTRPPTLDVFLHIVNVLGYRIVIREKVNNEST